MRAEHLAEFRERLSILSGCDERILAGIDSSEWYMPSPDDSHMLAVIADRLNLHLMTYRAGQLSEGKQGLCRRLVPAILDEAALEEIARLETTMPGAIVVAYARPLQTRDGCMPALNKGMCE